MEEVISHVIEPGVAAPPPRAARLPWRPQTLIILAIALCALLFAAGCRALFEAGRIGWIALDGRSAVAIVTEVANSQASAAGRAAAPMCISYQYQDPYTHLLIHRSVQVSGDPAGEADPLAGLSDAVQPARTLHPTVGERIPLRIARAAGGSASYFWEPKPYGEGLFLALTGCVVMGVSLRLFFALMHWRKFRVGLLRHGQAAIGTIIHKRNDHNDMSRYYLCYGYATREDGAALEHEEQVSIEQWGRYAIGQPVTVLYNPRRPAEAGLYSLMR